jgi:hypothetical protein
MTNQEETSKKNQELEQEWIEQYIWSPIQIFLIEEQSIPFLKETDEDFLQQKGIISNILRVNFDFQKTERLTFKNKDYIKRGYLGYDEDFQSGYFLVSQNSEVYCYYPFHNELGFVNSSVLLFAHFLKLRYEKFQQLRKIKEGRIENHSHKVYENIALYLDDEFKYLDPKAMESPDNFWSEIIFEIEYGQS